MNHASSKSTTKDLNQPIAVVGMACRFPGANTPEEFWDIIEKGKDMVKEIPEDRWDVDEFYDPDRNAVGKINTRYATFIDKIDDFDPYFFNISPSEAQEMRPEQKILLELTWQLIEDAQIPYRKIIGTKTGVFIGSIWNDIEHARIRKKTPINQYSSLGQSPGVMSGRISFCYGFTGPSITIDTSCASSLVALHYAMHSLRLGECDYAIVGGTNIFQDPNVFIQLSKFGGLASSGHCYSFDARADGFVRGEGASLILLKRLSDAENDHNKIYALVRNTSCNNNGFNDNLPATSIEGQLDMLKQAYSHLDFSPKDVQFVEMHGTGTKLGDPVEAKAVGQFFGVDRNPNDPLRIGSVKTNIGHQEANAGAAGFLKAALGLYYKKYPKNINFDKPNPEIDFNKLKIKVQTSIEDWNVPQNVKRRAGVNSFGFGGTNAHAVLEEYIPKNTNQPNINYLRDILILSISAKSEESLKNYAKLYLDYLEKKVGNSFEELYKFCATSAHLNPEFEHRLAFSGKTKEDFISQLKDIVEDEYFEFTTNKLSRHQKIVMIFPGQGSQRIGMGKSLYEKEPTFREAIDECDKTFKKFITWSIVEEIYAEASTSRLHEIDVIQPMICALQIALAKLLISWGVKPNSVVGHSMGEVAAAHIAGILPLEDAANIICTRSKLMKRKSGKGAMAVVELTYEEALKLTSRREFEGSLSVAVNNSPTGTVIAGDPISVEKVIQELEQKGLFARKVNVDVASHSPQMEDIKFELAKELENIHPTPQKIQYYSPCKDRVMQGVELTANYWADNLRDSVKFASSISRLLEDKHTIFIEISANPILTAAVQQCIESLPNKNEIAVIDTLRKDSNEHEEILGDIADFFSNGCQINWEAFFPNFKDFVKIPSYPWQKETYTLEDRSKDKVEVEGSGANGQAAHAFLGNYVPLAGMNQLHYWHNTISVEKFPFLGGHRVDNLVILPGSVYIEMVLEAINEVEKEKYIINNIHFDAPLILPEDSRYIMIQLKLEKDNQGIYHFNIYSRIEKQDNWNVTCHGTCAKASINANKNLANPALTKLGQVITGEKFYENCALRRIYYGDYFKGITRAKRENKHAFAEVTVNKFIKDSTLKVLRSHPALLDTCLHSLLLLTDLKNKGNTPISTFLTTSIGKIDFYKNIDTFSRLLLYMSISEVKTNNSGLETIIASLAITTIDGIVVASFENIQLKEIDDLSFLHQLAPAPIQNKSSTNDEQNKGYHFSLERLWAEANDSKRYEMLEHHIKMLTSKVTKSPLSKVKLQSSFKGLGVTSLVAMQLRSMLESTLNLKISVVDFWKQPTIKEYAQFIFQELLNQKSKSYDNEENISLVNSVIKTVSDWDKTKDLANSLVNIPKPNPQAKIKLICFHGAIQNSLLYYSWPELLPDYIEMIAVGKGDDLSETSKNVNVFLKELIPTLVKYLDKPFVFFGHSIGGALAFEAMRQLRENYKLEPVKLIASASHPPFILEGRAKKLEGIQDDELLRMFTDVNTEYLKMNGLYDTALRALKNDLEFAYSYVFNDKFEPFDVPVTAIIAGKDRFLSKEDVEEWSKVTCNLFNPIYKPEFEHNYIVYNVNFVIETIKKETREYIQNAHNLVNE
ncbi:MAG: hypothetical protein OHK0038_22740 [Flammeovirgaceae bacterium]